jgi:hypothetical protein
MSSRSRKKKRLRSLTHKVEHLRLEVEDRDETFKELEAEFMKELSELTDGSPMPEPQIPDPVPEQSAKVEVVGGDTPTEPAPESMVEGKNSEELPDDIKKIWKTIALMTHPDRTKNDPEKTEMYLAANRAADEGSVDEILRIATELNIEIPEDSPLVEAKLESIASELENKLKTMEGSVLWQWGQAEPGARKKIMDVYIAMRKLKKKSSPPAV